MNGGRFSALDALRFGYSTWQKQSGYCFLYLGFLEGCCLLAAFTLTCQLVLVAQLICQLEAVPPDSYFFAFLVIYLFLRSLLVLATGTWLLCLYDGKRLSFSDLLALDYVQNLALVARLLIATLVFNLLKLFGTVLLFVPGLLAGSTLIFYKFLIIERQERAMSGIGRSYAMASDDKLELVYLNLLSTFIKLVGLCLFGVGYLAAKAICGLAETYAYKKLLREPE